MNMLSVDVAFDSERRDSGAFDEFLDAVVDEFHAIRPDQDELDVVASLARYTATFVITVESATIDEAARALADLRTAIHAAGGSTPGWPTSHQITGQSMELCAS